MEGVCWDLPGVDMSISQHAAAYEFVCGLVFVREVCLNQFNQCSSGGKDFIS